MVFETILRSDLQKAVQVKPLTGNLFSADNGGNKITVKITDGGVDASVSGAVTGYVVRSDNKTVVINGDTVSDVSQVSIILPSSAYAVIGQVSIVVKVGTVTVGACTAYVYRTTTDAIVDPGNVIPSISELLAKIADCEAATSAANTAAGSANTAASAANTAAGAANTAAGAANTAASNANTAATKIDNMTANATGLGAGQNPTVNVTEDPTDHHKIVSFGIPKGDKGDPGKDFHIAKTFVSIAAMNAYTGSDIEAYDFAMIDTGSVEDPDTGKLYCYEPENTPKWRYIGDLSGAQGIKGETGTGITSVVLNNDYTLTINFSDGTSTTTGSVRGAQGPKGDKGDPGDATIDDTAGKGDTDKVWSADKIADQFEEFEHSDADKAVYLFRKTGGNAKAYNREKLRKLVGGTVAWNQKAYNGKAPTSRGGLTITSGSDSFIINGTATEDIYASGWFYMSGANNQYVSCSGHKVLVGLVHISGTVSNYNNVDFGFGGGSLPIKLGESKILSPVVSSVNNSEFHIVNGTQFTNAEISLQVIDLTAALGSTIADYLYTLETQTAGSGVALFRSLFDKSYYAYNAGSLESVNVSEHRVVGFNQWDEEWEVGSINGQGQNTTGNQTIRSKNYIPVLSNTAYYITTVMDGVFWYDANKNFISLNYSGGARTSPANACFMRFYTETAYGTTYKHDICINLSNAAKNGQYEPYTVSTYPMPNVTLRGIPKLVNNEIVFDGDELLPDGTVKRNYTEVTFNGTEEWSEYRASLTSEYYSYWIGNMGDFAPQWSSENVASMISTGYPMSGGNVYNRTGEGYATDNTKAFFICVKGITTVEAFKTWLQSNPVTFLCKVTTPTTESVDPYQELQICNRYGTEEFVDRLATAETNPRDVSIPVGHETVYYGEKLAKLDSSPDLPDENGDYFLRKTNNEAKYEKFPELSKIVNTPAGIISIEDGAEDSPVKQIRVAIEPNQDLHGQANPYPAGGGNNLADKMNRTGTLSGITVSVDDYGVITINGTASADNYIFGNVSISDISVQYTWAMFNASVPTGGTIEFSIRQQNTTSAGGWGAINSTNKTNTFTFTEGTTPAFWQLMIQSGTSFSNFKISPMVVKGTVAPTTFAPYSNLCPISGWSAAEVTRTGKNLFGGITLGQSIYDKAYSGQRNIDTTNKTVTFGRAADLDDGVLFDIFPTGKATAILTYSNSGNNNSLIFRYSDNSEDKIMLPDSSGTKTKIAVQSNTAKTLVSFELSYYGNAFTKIYYDESGIFDGTVIAADFEPYQSDTYTYPFPSEAGTVYGGTLTVNADGTGTLVVDRAFMTYSGASDESWNYEIAAAGNNFYINVPDSREIQNKSNSQLMCNMFGISTANYSQLGKVYISSSKNLNVTVGDMFDNVANWKTYLASNNLQVVYELATPVVYNLTELEVIELLKGVNNLWADCGNVEVLTYYTDNPVSYEIGQAARIFRSDANKLDKNQGSENSGKFMAVGSDGNVVPSNYGANSFISQSAAQNLINDADTNRIGQALCSIIPEYDSTVVYSENDLCVYWDVSSPYPGTGYRQKKIYRHKNWGGSTPAAESFTSSHWDEITIEEYLYAISGKLDASKIVYSSTQPSSPSTGMIWLKPVSTGE